MKIPEKLKNAKETLVEKTTTGLGKYVTILIPGIGDLVYCDIFKNHKKLKYGLAAGLTAAKIGGIASAAVTGDTSLLSLYYGFIVGEELGTAANDFFNYIDTKKIEDTYKANARLMTTGNF